MKTKKRIVIKKTKKKELDLLVLLKKKMMREKLPVVSDCVIKTGERKTENYL